MSCDELEEVDGDLDVFNVFCYYCLLIVILFFFFCFIVKIFDFFFNMFKYMF